MWVIVSYHMGASVVLCYVVWVLCVMSCQCLYHVMFVLISYHVCAIIMSCLCYYHVMFVLLSCHVCTNIMSCLC